jgi:hypothetical protein
MYIKHTNGPLPPVGPKNQCNSNHGAREDVFFKMEQARKGNQALLLENDHNLKTLLVRNAVLHGWDW